ncbi:hypothetical protein CA109_21055 [Salmonella enterica subsp. enterica serovar Bareilly]|nr:hypothetical protein [Salmonella enterica subsp. enterica serovar Bareilly]
MSIETKAAVVNVFLKFNYYTVRMFKIAFALLLLFVYGKSNAEQWHVTTSLQSPGIMDFSNLSCYEWRDNNGVGVCSNEVWNKAPNNFIVTPLNPTEWDESSGTLTIGLSDSIGDNVVWVNDKIGYILRSWNLFLFSPTGTHWQYIRNSNGKLVRGSGGVYPNSTMNLSMDLTIVASPGGVLPKINKVKIGEFDLKSLESYPTPYRLFRTNSPQEVNFSKKESIEVGVSASNVDYITKSSGFVQYGKIECSKGISAAWSGLNGDKRLKVGDEYVVDKRFSCDKQETLPLLISASDKPGKESINITITTW